MGILQARILEWVAMPSSRESSQHRDWTHVSCIAGGFFTIWATRDPTVMSESCIFIISPIILTNKSIVTATAKKLLPSDLNQVAYLSF